MSRYKKHECVLCGTRSGDVPHFRFPKDILQRTIWANFCDVDPASMSVSHKLCYRHFATEDLNDNRYCGGHCTKKPNAVPVIKHIPDLEEYYSTSEDEGDTVETVAVMTRNVVPSQVLLPKNQNLEESKKISNEDVEIVCAADFEDEEDSKSEASGSDASDEDYPCNYDDMDDVRKTVSLLQSIIAERKRKIRSVQQKNRRLLKKIKRARSDIAEYAQKHHINLNAKADASHSDDGMEESWWNKISEESEEALADKSENEL